jgi:hypothetical protein
MSKEKKTTPPSSGSGAAAPPTSPVQTCPKCNCCVTSVSIGNVRSFSGTTGFTEPNIGITLNNGHAFDFVMNFAFAAGTSGTSDCTFEWWEKVNLPALTGHAPNTWTDMFAGFPTSPTFNPWTNRVIPCPGGGNLTVTITDPPSLGNAPGRTLTRTLEFRLVAKSGSGCPCAKTSATATATQVLVMVNGVLDTAASSFTIGASSTTP